VKENKALSTRGLHIFDSFESPWGELGARSAMAGLMGSEKGAACECMQVLALRVECGRFVGRSV